MLFERICRENGITQRLTKPRSPTTTGKIERLHQTLQLELLNVHGPFASIEDAQAAVDAWRKDYNADRPHQSLAMAFPAARFTPRRRRRARPADPRRAGQAAAASRPCHGPAPGDQRLPPPAQRRQQRWQGRAVELDRVVPPSGNLWLAGQQIWLGPAMTGRTVRLWAGPGPGARAARRPPDQDPAVPAGRPRPGPPRRSRSPPGRAAAAAAGLR